MPAIHVAHTLCGDALRVRNGRRNPCETIEMTEFQDECWSRVKLRLRTEVGDAIYNSWFASMALESVEADTARISVPTRFLKSWISSHYVERLLSCWQSERPGVRRIDLSVRSAVLRTLPPCAEKVPAASVPPEKHNAAHVHMNGSAALAPPQDAHGGSPL